VRRTVLYADIFDYPLTREELFTFLDAPVRSRDVLNAAVDHALSNGSGLETDGRFLYRRGRSETVAIRRRRSVVAASAWRRARFYARLIWAIPFVRMVAITGALAVDNVEQGDDIDLLVVTETGRLWMTRGMIVLLCKLARLRGDALCPNYLITMHALKLEQRSLYAAHELAQMVPLHGRRVADRLRAENQWCLRFLPNLRQRERQGTGDRLPLAIAALKRLSETALRLPPGDFVERWERDRKMVKLSGLGAPSAETAFSADVCKGHLHGHGERVMRLLAARLGAPR